MTLPPDVVVRYNTITTRGLCPDKNHIKPPSLNLFGFRRSSDSTTVFGPYENIRRTRLSKARVGLRRTVLAPYGQLEQVTYTVNAVISGTLVVHRELFERTKAGIEKRMSLT